MTFTAARFVTPDHGQVAVTADGQIMFAPADTQNPTYAAVLDANLEIEPYTIPSPTADDVRREAARRINLLLGARDDTHALVIQAKGHEAALAILDRRSSGQELTPEEEDTVMRFRSIRAALEAIRTASNLLEEAPVADYVDDRHWPA
jgi:hypothetical protein